MVFLILTGILILPSVTGVGELGFNVPPTITCGSGDRMLVKRLIQNKVGGQSSDPLIGTHDCPAFIHYTASVFSGLIKFYMLQE